MNIDTGSQIFPFAELDTENLDDKSEDDEASTLAIPSSAPLSSVSPPVSQIPSPVSSPTHQVI